MAQRRATIAFFAIAFAFTWSLQLPGALARVGVVSLEPALYLPLAVLGIFGPMVAAVWLTLKDGGRPALRSLFASLLAWRVSPAWYLLALFVPGALMSAVLYAMRLAGHQGAWHFLADAPRLVSAILISVAEEPGWRAYALPRLTAVYGPVRGSCWLGAIWALWHVPMFMAVGVPMVLAPAMLVYFVGGSLFMTWLYLGSAGSLLIAVLAHLGAHLNNAHAALPADAAPLYVHTAVNVALGLLAMRSAVFEPGTARAANWAPQRGG
jgi:uncharacterized protein